MILSCIDVVGLLYQKEAKVSVTPYVHYRTDSEIFEDAVELQQFFIRIRDELCKNGEILMSPALSYTSKHLHSDVEKEKKEKLPKEFEEDKIKREEEKRGTLLKKYIFIIHQSI